MFEHDIMGVSGTKAQLRSRIVRHFYPDKDDNEVVQSLLFMNVEFKDREDLITQLCRFTLAELRTEMRRRGATSTGRKMDVVSRLALMIEQDKKAKIESAVPKATVSSSEGIRLDDVAKMNDADVRMLLDERTVGYGLFYSKYIDVLHFAYGLILGEAVLHHEEQPMNKEQLENLMMTNVKTIEAENENMTTIRARCEALEIPFSESDTKAAVIDRLKTDRLEDVLKMTSIDFHDEVLGVMKKWLKDIQDQLMQTPRLTAVRQLDDAAVWKRLEATEMRTSSIQEARQLIEQSTMLETEFHFRSLTILAAQLLHRLMQMRIEDISRALLLDGKLMRSLYDIPVYRDIANVVFVRASVRAFDVIYGETASHVAQMEEHLKETRPQRSEDEWDRMPDPPLSLALVFGGGSRISETCSAVRCVLDHVHTMPYSVDASDKRKEGIHVQLYLLLGDETSMSVHRMSTATFFSLGTSFDALPREMRDSGDVIGFEEFLTQIERLHGVISLTSSLDAFAEGNEEYKRRLTALDAKFLGGGFTERCLIRDRYVALTFLRKKGFIIPPLYRIRKDDFDDLESWNQGFLKWCGYHRMPSDQTFYLRPGNRVDRIGRSECSNAGDMIDKAKDAFDNCGMTEALIQPMTPSDGFVEFSCCVIETENGPKALLPTEYELLPSAFVRTLSVPFRRHTPPRFTANRVASMRKVAERAFEELHLRGFGIVHGRLIFDPEEDKKIRNERLQTPRPIPEFETGRDDYTLPEELVTYMGELQKEKEAELDAMVRSYDETKYTLETLRFFKFLDRTDAEDGFKVNRYELLKESIERIRHRHDKKESPFEDVWASLMKDELLDEAIESIVEPSVNDISTGHHYSVAVTGVDASIDFSTLGLIFHQAAVSGLSHAAVLRHLINLKLSHHLQLPPLPPVPLSWHPLFPENYNGIQYDPAKEIRSKHVWILCGGDGTGQQASLSTGLNALIKFRRSDDVQPHLFILDSGRRVAASPDVLKGLFDRREGFMRQGVPEEHLMKEVSTPYLSSPRTLDIDIAWRPVWCLHDAHHLSTTMDEAIEASERLRQLDSTSVTSHTRLTMDYEEMLLSCQKELHESGVHGVAGLWGGDAEKLPPRPRMMTMDVFAHEAEAVGAVVFVAVHGDVAQDGTLQSFLAERNVPYTGCGITASQLCRDKEETAAYLDKLDFVSALSQRSLPKASLVACANDSDISQALFQESQDMMDNASALCLKPTSNSFGTGTIKISKPQDLEIYAQAIVDESGFILGNRFSPLHRRVIMPKPAAENYLLEPYIHPINVVYGRNQEWVLADRSAFVEVSFGLVGDLGRMWVLTPSLVLSHLESEERIEDRLLYGLVTNMTPIPESIVRRSRVEKAKKAVEKLADAMGLKGVARVDAFMHVQTGELYVMEVDSTPYLGEHSTILQQAVLESPPMYPDEVFQQILRVANSTEYENEDIHLSDSVKEDAAEDFESWEDDILWNKDDTDDLIDRLGTTSTSEPQESLSDLWDSDDSADGVEETQTV